MNTYAIVSDLHYYSKKLGTEGKAYKMREGSDQKCLAESGAIIKAAFDQIISDGRADAVIIPGDLTNDGEMYSHEELREILRTTNEKLPVFLTVATHDWCCDKNARRYEGENTYHDVDTLSCSDIAEYYSEFGRDKIISKHITEKQLVSYCFALSKGVRLLALNDDSNGENASGFDAAHLKWICEQIKEAKEAGEVIFAAEHHLVMPNLSMLINSGHVIGNDKKTTDVLADCGLRLVFTGHSHMHRNTVHTSPAGNKITQINVGALTGYPSPISYLTIDGTRAVIETDTLREFSFNGKTFGADYIKTHTENLLLRILRSASADKDDFFDILRSNGIKTDLPEKFYREIQLASNFLLTVNIKRAARIINRLTLGRGVSLNAAEKIKNEKLIDNILPIFLSVFDGGMHRPAKGSPLYTLVSDVSSLPYRALRFIPVSKEKKKTLEKVFTEVIQIAHELIEPSGPDIMHTEVELC